MTIAPGTHRDVRVEREVTWGARTYHVVEIVRVTNVGPVEPDRLVAPCD